MAFIDPDTVKQPGTGFIDPDDVSDKTGVKTIGGTNTANVPEWGRKNPRLYGVAGAAYETMAPLAEATGLVGGGMVGAAGGGPAGAILGAGVGSAIAKRGTKIARVGLGVDKPETLTDMYNKTKDDITSGSLMEMTGQVGGAAIGAVSKPLIDSLVKTKAFRQLYDAAKSLEYELTPAQETGSKSASLIERALSYIPGSAGIMQRKAMAQLERLTQLREDFITKMNNGQGVPESVEKIGLQLKSAVEQFVGGKQALKDKTTQTMVNDLLGRMGSGDTYESLGMKTKDILNARSAAAVAKKNSIYKEVGAEIPQGDHDAPLLMTVAKKHLAELDELPIQDSSLKSVLKWAAKEVEDPESTRVLDSIKDMPPKVQQQIMESQGIKPDMVAGPKPRTWETYQNFRNQLSDLARGENTALGKQAPGFKGQVTNEGRIYEELKKALDSDMEGIAKQSGSKAWEKLQAANTFYSTEYAPIWKNKLVQQLAYSNPTGMIDLVFKKGNEVEIDTLKKAIGDKAFGNIKAKFVSQIVENAGKSGEFSWEGVWKELSKYGNETLGHVFTPQEWKTLSTYVSNGIHQQALPVADKFLVDVIKKSDPSVISNLIFHPNNSRNVELIKNVVPKKMWDEARATWLAKNILKVSKYEHYLPITSSTQMFKMDAPTMKAILNPEERAFMDKMYEVSKSSEVIEKLAGNPSGTAQAVITWEAGRMVLNGIAGAGYGLATGNIHAAAAGAASAAGIPLIPMGMAKLYLSPVGRSLIVQGMKLPPGSPQAAALATKLLALAEGKSQFFNKGEGE